MKKLITALLALTLVFSLTACTNSGDSMGNNSDNKGIEDKVESIMPDNNMSGTSTPLNSDGNQNNASQAKLSYDEAKAAALKHAGINKDDVKFLRCELDRDDGALKYEVEFTKDGVEYEYDIDANNGTVLWVDKDYD